MGDMELKPCPLCGSTDIACFAEECGNDYDNVPTFRAVVGCRGCREEGCDPSYDDEPCFGIEAYYRVDHPLVRDCEDPWDIESVIERHMAERWNRRAERTCHIVVSIDRNPASYGGRVHRCSACGKALPGALFRNGWTQLDYCPRCGARVTGVVRDDD